MHMWRSLFLGESATLPCEGGEPQRSPVLGFLLYLGVHYLTQNDHVRQGNTCGEGRDYWGQKRFQSQGAEPQRSPSFGFPSIYVYTVRRKTAEFCVITHTHRRRDFFLSSPTPFIPKRDRVPAEPTVWEFFRTYA